MTKTKNHFLALSLAAAFGQGFTPLGVCAEQVSVARFGAAPDDGIDDAESLRQSIRFCKDHPGTILYFPPGVYDLRDEAAVQLMNDVMTGKMGQDPEKTIFTALLSRMSEASISEASPTSRWRRRAQFCAATAGWNRSPWKTAGG